MNSLSVGRWIDEAGTSSHLNWLCQLLIEGVPSFYPGIHEDSTEGGFPDLGICPSHALLSGETWDECPK
ncbi:hypothetical protein [Scytonema sp. PCC 10023]|uniref:hypothetical protein n=1 Tax=Scytonema sp. PCC 10023 TaxID=1680591 RepID=UPI0039C65EE5